MTTRLCEALVDQSDFLRNIVQGALQRLPEEATTLHLNADSNEKAEGRHGYLNGYRPQQLKTRVSTLHLPTPIDRKGTHRTELLDRYQHSEKALGLSLMAMHLEDVSTRRVKDITEVPCPLRGVAENAPSFSKSPVSRLAGQLDTDLTEWREPWGGWPTRA